MIVRRARLVPATDGMILRQSQQSKSPKSGLLSLHLAH